MDLDIRLRRLRSEDCDIVLSWSRDPIFCEANGWEKNRDPEELKQWWSYCVDMDKPSFIRLGIEHEGTLVGYADLAEIHDDQAELGIAIGERKVWGRGIGRQAALAIIEYGKMKLGIKSFAAETHESNTRCRSMLEKVGFAEIGRAGHEWYCGQHDRLIQYRRT
ncbi:GNAT family N-acetyltransferase [Saccharibacillus sacchari]|uniref:GNAT family N-acetyltransferase n=1 Tax=Saccharibacillus sacchari TaxID=456493 RepID=UPI0004BA21EC|nr:GNAT family N-acetyltransferase [Saccharibacillus sacchari]